MRTINNEDLDDETKIKAFDEHLKKLVDLNLEIVVSSIDYIELPDGNRVNSSKFIKEYFENCENSVFKKMLSSLEELNSVAELPTVNLLCEECEKEYTSKLEFDYSNFFDVRY